MEKQIHIQGLLNDARQFGKSYSRISSAERAGIGRFVNEIQISAVLKNEHDIDDLIEVLLNHIPCFSKSPG